MSTYIRLYKIRYCFAPEPKEPKEPIRIKTTTPTTPLPHLIGLACTSHTFGLCPIGLGLSNRSAGLEAR